MRTLGLSLWNGLSGGTNDSVGAAANKVVSAALTVDKLRALCDPANYLGSAGAMTDAIVARHRGS